MNSEIIHKKCRFRGEKRVFIALFRIMYFLVHLCPVLLSFFCHPLPYRSSATVTPRSELGSDEDAEEDEEEDLDSLTSRPQPVRRV